MATMVKENTVTSEQAEINELISALIILPREDRAVLLANANVLLARREIEKTRKGKEQQCLGKEDYGQN